MRMRTQLSIFTAHGTLEWRPVSGRRIIFMTRAAPLASLLLLAAVPLGAQEAKGQAAIPACQQNQLSLATDGENGTFDGMSHSGTLLVLRNLGSGACRIAPIANLALADSSGKDLLPQRAHQGPPGLHPGPVVIAIVLPEKAELTAELRWISGNVFDHGACISPTQLQASFGDTHLRTTIKATVCWDSSTVMRYNGIRFAPDPVYTPEKQP